MERVATGLSISILAQREGGEALSEIRRLLTGQKHKLVLTMAAHISRTWVGTTSAMWSIARAFMRREIITYHSLTKV